MLESSLDLDQALVPPIKLALQFPAYARKLLLGKARPQTLNLHRLPKQLLILGRPELAKGDMEVGLVDLAVRLDVGLVLTAAERLEALLLVVRNSLHN